MKEERFYFAQPEFVLYDVQKKNYLCAYNDNQYLLRLRFMKDRINCDVSINTFRKQITLSVRLDSNEPAS